MDVEEPNPDGSSDAEPAPTVSDADGSDGLASLARDVDKLMSAPRQGSTPTDGGDDGADQVELLLREINEILTHDTNALLSSTNNLLGQALETIFDPQALAKKNEKIDKALAQALAKSRGAPGAPISSVKAPVTNPAPRFAGISRPMTADFAKANLKPTPAPKVASGPRAPLPTEPTVAPVVKMGDAPAEDNSPVTTKFEEKAPEPEPTPAPEPVVEAPKPAPKPVEKPPEKPKAEAPKPEPQPAAEDDGSPPLVLRILAIPMRFVPDSAKFVVSAAALTMLFSMPVAWVLAHRSASNFGIGPVDFSVEGALEDAEQAEKAHAAAEAKKTSAADAADKSGGKAAEKTASAAQSDAK
jgi:hypothetical protein